MESSVSLHFPALYFPPVIALLALLAETWLKRLQPWALPAALLYVTVFAWYFADLFVTPEEYTAIPDSLLNISYCQVAAFLLIYRLAVPWLTKRFIRRAEFVLRRSQPLSPRVLFFCTVILWGGLLCIAVAVMNGDLIGALFPLDARTGSVMWGRAGGSDAGATGFLISSGGYIYGLVSAAFGVWVNLLRRTVDRVLAFGFMLLTWPHFYLSGTRSAFLAVSLPFFISYLLFGRQQLWIKIVCLVVAFVGMDTALRVAVTYRSVGFRSFFSDADDNTPETLSRHKGLNMIEELCYVNEFTATEGMSYGANYAQELVGVVPRVIWPAKPMLGIDYAIWRGFGGADNDLGVFATISTGMIGGGVRNFGRFFGPVAAALLMAAWTALLARMWVQRASLLRCFLFLAGLGLMFNLGRDITLLVLWPFVFGYAIVRVVEFLTRKPHRRKRPGNRNGNSIIFAEGPNKPQIASMNRPS